MKNYLLFKRGQELQDHRTGKKIAEWMEDIYSDKVLKPSQVGNYAEGETPYQIGQVLDGRCFRRDHNGYIQCFVDGKWKGLTQVIKLEKHNEHMADKAARREAAAK